MKNSALNPANDNPALLLNSLGLAGICASLLMAFWYQLALSELPCPLCLLQRAALIMAGCGFLFNIRLGVKGSHYAMVLIGGLVTGVIASRQMLLHILPGDAGYGSPFLDIHFYTWAVVAAAIIVLAVAFMLAAGDLKPAQMKWPVLPAWNNVISLVFILLIAGNLVSTLLECGGGQCADNPVIYQLLH